MNYYLDIETTGKDPMQDKIITIQYQKLDRYTANPVDSLKILKEWESDEKAILTKFILLFLDGNSFFILIVGFLFP